MPNSFKPSMVNVPCKRERPRMSFQSFIMVHIRNQPPLKSLCGFSTLRMAVLLIQSTHGIGCGMRAHPSTSLKHKEHIYQTILSNLREKIVDVIYHIITQSF